MENILSGDYIAGFVDGEGCFWINYRKDIKYKRAGQPTYYYWDIGFAIVLRNDDIDILERIRKVLMCGKITKNNNTVRYEITDLNDLQDKIIPFFDKYQLKAKKKDDYGLWKIALNIFIKKNNNKIRYWGQEDIEELSKIYKKMINYKSGFRMAKHINNIHTNDAK